MTRVFLSLAFASVLTLAPLTGAADASDWDPVTKISGHLLVLNNLKEARGALIYTCGISYSDAMGAKRDQFLVMMGYLLGSLDSLGKAFAIVWPEPDRRPKEVKDLNEVLKVFALAHGTISASTLRTLWKNLSATNTVLLAIEAALHGRPLH
jgi:hypothetical protein